MSPGRLTPLHWVDNPLPGGPGPRETEAVMAVILAGDIVQIGAVAMRVADVYYLHGEWVEVTGRSAKDRADVTVRAPLGWVRVVEEARA